MNHDVTMNWDYQILVKNESELLWSLADDVILVVYPLKFIFSYSSYSGWISSDTNRFGFNSVRVISGSRLHQVNKSSGHIGFRVEINSTLSHVGLGLVSGRSIRVIQFGSFGSGHFCQV